MGYSRVVHDVLKKKTWNNINVDGVLLRDNLSVEDVTRLLSYDHWQEPSKLL